MTKIYDVVAVTGEYQNRDGDTKKRYENVGVIMDKGNGAFLMLKRTFNPAGLDAKGDSVILSLFAPKEGQSAHGEAKQNGYAPQVDLSDDLPF